MTFTFNGVAQIAVYFLLLLLITKPMGLYLNAVFAGRRTWLSPVLRPVERAIYWVSGVDEEREQDWKIYTVAMLLFSAAGMLLLYGIQRAQSSLAAQSAGAGGGGSCVGLQYRRQLHDEHQLAELRWRDHDELSDADGWSRLP